MPVELPKKSSVVAAVRLVLEEARLRRRTTDAMASMVAVTSDVPLTHLDAWEKAIRAELWAARPSARFQRRPWWRLWRLWRLWDRTARPVVWLDLCNADGFLREKALRALREGTPHGFVFALALRRLNDWVPEVRAAARRELPRMAEHSDPEHIVDALWSTLANCASWGRIDGSMRQALVTLLSLPHVVPAVRTRILRSTAGPAARILAQALRTPALDGSIEEFATSAIQPAVRASAYRCLLEGRAVCVVGRKWRWTDLQWCAGRFETVLEERPLSGCGPVLATLRSAAADRSPQVRRFAAGFLLRQLAELGAEARPIAEVLAADPDGTVAARGRFALAALGGYA